MTTFDVGYELTDAIVTLLRGDSELNALLFTVTPRLDVNDDRVYDAGVELPEGPIREVLPRILVDVSTYPYDVEQKVADGSSPLGSADIDLITLVDADYRELGESLYARERELIASTSLEGSTIICAELVPQGLRRPVREVAFRNAWRLTLAFRAGLVGVR